MARKKSESTITRRYYYISNINDTKFFSHMKLGGSYTIMSTRKREECVLYTTLEQAAAARNEIKGEILNINFIEKKVSTQLNAM